jgi:hypothetical protein
VLLRSISLNSSHYLTVNVPHVHHLPEYRLQLDVSLPLEDIPESLALSEILPQSDFGDFPHHPLNNKAPVLNGPTSRNPNSIRLAWRQDSWPASDYPSTRTFSIQVTVSDRTEIFGSAVM